MLKSILRRLLPRRPEQVTTVRRIVLFGNFRDNGLVIGRGEQAVRATDRVSCGSAAGSACTWGQPVPPVRLLTPSIDRLSERERERFNAGIEKLDLKEAFVDGSWLPNQLIETLLGHGAVTSVINVGASGEPSRLSIDVHPETH